MSKYKEVLAHFADAPDSIIDESLTVKLKVLSEKDEVKSDEILEILDLGARYALMSELGMTSLNAVWCVMLKDEGKTVEEAFKEAEPRRKAAQES